MTDVGYFGPPRRRGRLQADILPTRARGAAGVLRIVSTFSVAPMAVAAANQPIASLLVVSLMVAATLLAAYFADTALRDGTHDGRKPLAGVKRTRSTALVSLSPLTRMLICVVVTITLALATGIAFALYG